MKPIHLLAKNTFEHSGATISSRGKMCTWRVSHCSFGFKKKKLVPSTRCYRHRQGTFVECQSRTTRTPAGVAGGRRWIRNMTVVLHEVTWLMTKYCVYFEILQTIFPKGCLNTSMHFLPSEQPLKIQEIYQPIKGTTLIRFLARKYVEKNEKKDGSGSRRRLA